MVGALVLVPPAHAQDGDARVTSAKRATPKPGVVTPRCKIDLGIGQVFVSKAGTSGASGITINTLIMNHGTGTWKSRPGQQILVLALRNESTGKMTTIREPIPAGPTAGRNVMNYSSPVLHNVFDGFEFGGSIEIRIEYDPDIRSDAEPCNDDTNASNDHRVIPASRLTPFLLSSRRSGQF